MNFELTDDQQSVLSGLEQLLGAIESPATQHAASYVPSPALGAALAESGFLGIAQEEGFGALEAALVVERVAREPQVVEVGASALIAPLLSVAPQTRSIALVTGEPTRPARFLPTAERLVVLRDDEAFLLPVDRREVERVETLLAYPYGRLRQADLASAKRLGNAAAIRRRWRVAIAAEAAGAMAAAMRLVLDHVTSRYAFGRPLGSFQAIHHRLAMAAETAESTRWLALRAAWSDDEEDAAIAAGFAQARVAGFTYDLHQFVGAMGLTLEFPLHLWTYRLRALLGELGGSSTQARTAAQARWGAVA